MQIKKIKKFQCERRYSAETCDDWFELIEREGKELTFKVYPVGNESNYKLVKVTAAIKSDGDGVFEEAKIVSNKGIHVIYAHTWTSRGRRLSELPADEAKRVRDAVSADVERRKRNGED